MWLELRGYLLDLAWRLKLDPRRKGEILRELETHLEEEVCDLQEEGGLDRAEAVRVSLERLGQPRELARHYYEVYGRASWGEVSLAALPHLLFALLFAFHLWTAGIWVALLLVGMAGVAILAWRGGQPSWHYPWLGYSLVLPVVGGGLSVLALGSGGWELLHRRSPALSPVAYVGMLLLLPVVYVTVKRVWAGVIERDWLFAPLAALPLPFVASWLRFAGQQGGLVAGEVRLAEVDVATGLLFLGLALTTAVFYRLASRAARLAVLTVGIPLLVFMGSLSYQGSPFSLWVFLLLVLVLAVVVLPAYDDARHNPSGGRPAV